MEYLNAKQIKKAYEHDCRLCMFSGRIPAKIKHLTLYYMDYYCVTLSDAFESAVKESVKKGCELWAAWYYVDFRKFIPSAYVPDSLDFKKHPLAYKYKKGLGYVKNDV